MIDVLVVEDSQVIREYLVFALEADPELRVVATAADGEEAVACVARRRPAVVLMDIHLPGIDGLEATRRIMASHPVPIVACTASTRFDEVHTAMRALEAGALAVLKKPRGLGDPQASVDCAAIIDTLKLMSEVKVVRRWNRTATTASAAAAPAPLEVAGHEAAVVAIGASTGGPPVVLQILSGLSPAFPAPILVVQHISAGFTVGFAEWLAAGSGLPVHVAQGGETPLPGHVYVAPDDRHLVVGSRGELQTTLDGSQSGLRPSVGVLFRSVAERFGRRAVGVLLTGMGRDGAEELKRMADQGALTVAQDEESCTVFGMPGEAIRLGAAGFVFPPRRIAEFLTVAVRRGANQGVVNG
ncbi:MAG: chemotaxis-specific protein-glutamate methyltransferase CheB [Thermoleophilaceae bacterium]|nr:chemotaxis-specific protein-glutamate methyltransferase CheB [Thermoleophilaceae bacterium]